MHKRNKELKFDIIPNEPNVIAIKIRNSPDANEMFPNQSIFSRLNEPISFKFVYDRKIPIIPIGIFIQKIDLQPKKEVKNPPKTRPRTDPNIIATWLMPNALPLSFTGKASVRIATLFEKINAAPIAWINLNSTNCSPVCDKLHNADAKVNIVNPNLYNFTLPKISERRPKFKRIEAVTREYPITIQTIVLREALSSEEITGKAIKIILVSSDARIVPRVVLLNAIHLYAILPLVLLLKKSELFNHISIFKMTCICI